MSETEKQLEALYDRAEQLRQAGRPENIIPVAEEILTLDPKSPRALQVLAMWHLGKGDYAAALKYLEPFNKTVPSHEGMMLPLAVTYEELGDFESALKVLKRVLRLNENNFFAYLYLGSVLEKTGNKEQAAWAYSFAVDINPSLKTLFKDETLPKPARVRVTRCNDFLTQIGQNLHKQAVAKAREKFPKGDFTRIERALWRKLHHARVGITNPAQRPLSFFIPDLDRAPWFEREEFPWLEDFEKDFPHILNEVLKNYRGDQDTLPYLQRGGYDEKAWGDLVGSKQWAACHLYDGMNRKEANCARFPETTAAVDKLPLFRVKGRPVEVLLSILKPKTKIPPHYGTSNARLTVHLPLVAPEGCYLRAGHEERPVEAGKTFFFDDSFDHEARNDSDQVRIVLIFEVWHPDLREEERLAIEESYAAYEAWMLARDHDALLNG